MGKGWQASDTTSTYEPRTHHLAHVQKNGKPLCSHVAIFCITWFTFLDDVAEGWLSEAVAHSFNHQQRRRRRHGTLHTLQS